MDKNDVSGSFLQIVGILLQPLGLFFVLFFSKRAVQTCGALMKKKTPPKWQKNDLVSGGHGRAAKLGACLNWVDWLRTSADKRMWSGRRAVVMV